MQLSVKAWLAFTDRKEEDLASLLKGEDVNINIRVGIRMILNVLALFILYIVSGWK